MATMNISLPDPLKDFIEDRVAEGHFSTTSEYFRDLVREDQKRKAIERFDALLLEGLDSGEPVEATPQFWQDLRERIEARRNRERTETQ